MRSLTCASPHETGAIAVNVVSRIRTYHHRRSGLGIGKQRSGRTSEAHPWQGHKERDSSSNISDQEVVEFNEAQPRMSIISACGVLGVDAR